MPWIAAMVFQKQEKGSVLQVEAGNMPGGVWARQSKPISTRLRMVPGVERRKERLLNTVMQADQ